MPNHFNLFRVCGEWKGEFKTLEEAIKELDSLVNHEVLGNQFWWIENEFRKEIKRS